MKLFSRKPKTPECQHDWELLDHDPSLMDQRICRNCGNTETRHRCPPTVHLTDGYDYWKFDGNIRYYTRHYPTYPHPKEWDVFEQKIEATINE